MQTGENSKEHPLTRQFNNRQKFLKHFVSNRPLLYQFWPGANVRCVDNFSRNIAVPQDSTITVATETVDHWRQATESSLEHDNCRGLDLNTIFGDVSSTDFDCRVEEL